MVLAIFAALAIRYVICDKGEPILRQVQTQTGHYTEINSRQALGPNKLTYTDSRQELDISIEHNGNGAY